MTLLGRLCHFEEPHMDLHRFEDMMKLLLDGEITQSELRTIIDNLDPELGKRIGPINSEERSDLASWFSDLTSDKLSVICRYASLAQINIIDKAYIKSKIGNALKG